MGYTAVASQWYDTDEPTRREEPVIYIDENNDQIAEIDLHEATALLDDLMLAVLQAREWIEGFVSITGVTPNFIYSLKATVGHTGGVYAQD